MSAKRSSFDHDVDHRWFAPSDKAVPQARFEDVTMEIDLSDVTLVKETPAPVLAQSEVPAPILPQPAHRTSTPLPAGARRDERFSDLSVILREARVILTEKHGLSETDVDAFEWQLRTKIANL